MKTDPVHLAQLEQVAHAWLKDHAELTRLGQGPAPMGAVRSAMHAVLGIDGPQPFAVFRSPRVLVVTLEPTEETGQAELHVLPAGAILNANAEGLAGVGESLKTFWEGYMSANKRLHHSRQPAVPGVVRLRQAISDALGNCLPAAMETDQLFCFAVPIKDPQRRMRLAILPIISVIQLSPSPTLPAEDPAEDDPDTRTRPGRGKDAARKTRRAALQFIR